MKSLYFVFALALCMACSGKKSNQAMETQKDPVNATLFDKDLSEIKELLNGKWTLISGENGMFGYDFEDIYIAFNNDKYIWTEDGVDDPGALNWRKAETGNGYEAYMMDVFMIPEDDEDRPAYPLAIRNDTLIIQEYSADATRYKLVRTK